MPKSKPLIKLTEALAGTSRQLPNTLGIARQADEVVELSAIDALLKQANDETVLNNRAAAISDPTFSAEDARFYQTESPEEYAVRITNQLEDPVHSAKALYGDDLALQDVQIIPDIEKSIGTWKETSEVIFNKMGANPRWKQRIDQWYGDSAYKGRVIYHTDKWTDPTRHGDFIQFIDPMEMGLHGGSSAAAGRFIGFGGNVNAAISVEKDGQQLIKELSLMAGIPTRELEGVFARRIEDLMVQKFTKGGDRALPTDDEWSAVLREVSDALGEGAGEEAAILAKQLADVPKPNTTPFLFRGKNGLLLRDEGGFTPGHVYPQLEQLFPDDADEILAIMGRKGKLEKTKGLQAFIESKGYDHVVYHNAVEDKGTLSIINWNPDLQTSLWDDAFTAGDPKQAASIIAGAMTSALGFGSAALRDE